MTVYLPPDCKTWRFRFRFNKKAYSGNTEQSTEAKARVWEQAYRDRLNREREDAAQRRARGIPEPTESPRFTDWAAVYLAHVRRLTEDGRLTRPERIEDLLRVVLRFWGAKPSGKNPKIRPVEGEPYHDLRLGDPIVNPIWVLRFEDWMTARGIAGQTKNQYRSVVRQMFELAQQPQWRVRTGIQVNPMNGIYRDRPKEREVTVTPAELRALLEHASYHLRLAVAIGALAPKLRLSNILALEWDVHIDAALRFITVYEHKTARATRRPLVMPVTQQLRKILEDARARNRGRYVVTYRGKPFKSLRGALKAAATAAGIPYGRFVEGGVTFHTLRHTAATMLAELDVSEAKRKAVMGHRHIATTQKYTHLRPMHEVQPLEELSAGLPIEDLVTVSWRRASRKAVNEPVKLRPNKRESSRDDASESENSKPAPSSRQLVAKQRR